MRLELKIGSDEGTATALWPSNIGLCDGSQLELKVPGLKVNENDKVWASIEGFEGGDRNKFSMQTGWDPDEYFNAVAKDGVLYYRDPENESAHLFYGCMGKTLLRLSKDGDDLFSIWIDVVPRAERLCLFRKMLAEIFHWNPFLALSNALGQSQLPVSESGAYGSDDGYASIAVEVEAINKLIEKLKRPMFQINQSPSVEVVDQTVQAPSRFARRITSAGFQRMAAIKDSPAERLHLRVRQRIKLVSLDTVYNRSIAGFLRKVFMRTQSLKSSLDDMCDGLNEVISFIKQWNGRKGKVWEEWEEYKLSKKADWRDGVRQYVSGFSSDDILRYSRDGNNELKSSLSNTEELRADLQEYIRQLRVFLNCEFVKACKSGGMSLETPLNAFPQTAAYREVFAIMNLFMRMRFVWRFADGSNDVCNYEYDDKGRSAWVRKYSMVYESWVFLRLLRGLESEDFPVEKSYRQTVFSQAIDAFLGAKSNTPIVVSSDNGAFSIEVIHGVVAPVKTKNMVNYHGFCCRPVGNRECVTPDFAIVFKNLRCAGVRHSQYVIVLDAKSGWRLNADIEKQLDKYSGHFFIDVVSEQPAHQVWLVYSGLEVGKSGVEFNSAEPPPGACWDADLADKNILQGDRPFIWKENYIDGINTNFKGVIRGFLRANASTVVENDVFAEFMHVQIGTARRLLGLEGVKS